MTGFYWLRSLILESLGCRVYEDLSALCSYSTPTWCWFITFNVPW